jgi:hypothetical protein
MPVDWLRLQDQFDSLEAGRKRPESYSRTLCQEPWTDCGLFKPPVDKPSNSGRRVSVYPTSVDVTGQ